MITKDNLCYTGEVLFIMITKDNLYYTGEIDWFSNIFKINKISNKKEYYLLVDEKEMVMIYEVSV
jgi:hypothetical protein